MKKTALTILPFLLLTTTYAQRDTLEFGLGMLFPEFNQGSISDFNEYLAINNFPTTTYWPFSFHLGGSLYYNKFRASVYMGGLFSQPEKFGDTTIQSATNFISIDLAYELFTLKRFRVYPFAGYKMTGFDYDFEINKNYKTIQAYLQAPVYDKRLEYSKRNLILGVGIEYGDKVLFGIRAGLYVPLENGGWSFADNHVNSGVPIIDFKYFVGFYWQLKTHKLKNLTIPIHR